MKVRNVTNANYRAIANQFIIEDDKGNEYLQSYQSVIVKRTWINGVAFIELDEKDWDYSNTTGKYRNQFLGETIKETRAKIKSGEYKLADLNQ